MKKHTTLLLICFLLVLQSSFAQTSIIFNANPISFNALPTPIIGQSFTATQNGLITNIQVAPLFTASSVLNIYSGDGFGGALLHTQNVNLTDLYNDGNNTYTFQTITIDASVAITNGSVYTFSFSDNSFLNTFNLYGGGHLYDPLVNNGDTPFSILQGAAPAALTFLPASGTWSSAANWSPAQVPTSIDNVTIPASKTVTINASAAVVNTLTIDFSGTLVVNPTGALTANSIDNQGQMLVHSDASNNGSVITNGYSNNGVSYYRYLTGGDWHLISTPLTGLSNQITTIASFISSYGAGMTQSGVKYSLAPYDNNFAPNGQDTWKNYTSNGDNSPPATHFGVGKGYEILMNSSGVVAFIDNIQIGSPSITLTDNVSSWNLIGNPYASSFFGNVNADATNNFLTVNSAQLDQSFVSMYVWNPGNSSYDIVNQASGARSIPPGQAFFVKAKSGGGSANFTTAMRTHQTANNFQKGVTTGIPTITLSADNNSGTVSSTNIKYMSGTTLGLDPGYDAGQFGATGAGNFNLYTQLVQDNGVNFMLQVVPDTNYETTVIPVGIDANSGTQLTFKATAIDLPTGKKVFLEDKLLNTITEINNTDKSYTVTLSSSLTGSGRFFIHTKANTTLAIDDFSASQYRLVTSPEQNNIRLYGAVAEKGSINIFDVFGRKIHSTTLKTGSEQDINVPVMSTGVYIVKFNIDNKPFSKKIMWY